MSGGTAGVKTQVADARGDSFMSVRIKLISYLSADPKEYSNMHYSRSTVSCFHTVVAHW